MSKIHHMAGKLTADKHVIFIHGLDGHYKKTWSEAKNKKNFWPEWLVGHEKNICIWSVEYGAKAIYFYDDSMALKTRAENIAEQIYIIEELKGREIMLIGHSMGGLIIKQMIRLSFDQEHREEARLFLSSISGIAFLGTPHAGSDLSTLGNTLPIRIILKIFCHNPSVITASLSRNNADLRELNQWYREWDKKFTLTRLIIGESKKTKFWGMIVKSDSSDPGLTTRMFHVDKNHTYLSKPESKDDEVFRHIKNFVSQPKREAQNIWIKVNTGNFPNGWQGYNNWTGPSNKSEYILDDKIKFSDIGLNDNSQINAIDAIQLVRSRLSEPCSSVRLVGLSGVGKTRFAQALFEDSVGRESLSKDLVFYTDMASSPEPAPENLLEKMIYTSKKAILIIDNCDYRLHNLLTLELNKISKDDTKIINISLLTIEYDIRDDAPEYTNIIKMEDNSQDLIVKLLNKDYPKITSRNAHKIADFSGGNARIAMALASSVEKYDDISRLRHEELFTRLFHQRHGQTLKLQKAGEIFSLFYSFQLESEEEYSSELIMLSNLSGIPPGELYSSAKELHRRGLAQIRSVWMAILPHPVANRLADLCLQNIPAKKIIRFIHPVSTPRLFSSFTRRLGYLSDSEIAKGIVQNFLSPQGGLREILTTVPSDSPIDYTKPFTIINNIAPLAPIETLEFIKWASNHDVKNIFLTRKNPEFITITRLLHHLAYDANIFYECALLLYIFSESESPDEKNNSIHDILSSLFTSRLSGTHASLELRISFIREEVLNGRKDITYKVLGSLLKVSHFLSYSSFDFGASVRDYGYMPASQKEWELWILTCLSFIKEILDNYPNHLSDVNLLLTSNLRGLWASGLISVQDELINIFDYLIPIAGSADLWIAVSSILKFDSKNMPEESRSKLDKLKTLSSADTLEKKCDLLIFSRGNNFYGFEETDSDGNVIRYGYDVINSAVEELASVIAHNHPDFIEKIVIRCLTLKNNGGRLNIFSHRLAMEIPDKEAFFSMLYDNITSINDNNVSSFFLAGALNGLYEKDSILTNSILDTCLETKQLIHILPDLFLSIPLDNKGIERIKSHLLMDNINISQYQLLAWGRRHEVISDKELCDLMLCFLSKPKGLNVVFEIINMRLFIISSDEYMPSEPFLDFSRGLILATLLNSPEGMDDQTLEHFKVIAEKTFNNTSRDNLELLLSAITECIEKNSILSYPFKSLVEIIIHNDVMIVLDAICPSAEEVNKKLLDSLGLIFYYDPIALDGSQDEIILNWCRKAPACRYNYVIKLVTPYLERDGNYLWSPLAMQFIMECHDVDSVLKEMVDKMWPRTHEGSQVEEMLKKRPLLVELLTSTRAEVSSATKLLLSTYDSDIQNTRIYEKRNYRRFERFE